MTRMNLVAIAGLAGAFFGLQPAQAYEAPWCAVIQLGPGAILRTASIARSKTATAEAIFWPAIVAPAIRASTMSPTLQNTRAQRNAALGRSSSSTGQVVNVRYWRLADIGALGLLRVEKEAAASFSQRKSRSGWVAAALRWRSSGDAWGRRLDDHFNNCIRTNISSA